MQGLYENLFYSKAVNELFTDDAFLGYMLRFEAALAKAQAKCGLIPASVAVIIEECCDVKNIDIDLLREQIALSGNAAIPLIKQLTTKVDKQSPDAARYVHFGATSQDVIDTATILQLKDVSGAIKTDLDKLISQLVILAETHRETVMIGRTFLQHARPISFGFKVVCWIDGLLRSRQRIERLFNENFVLQLGGAVGTLSGMEDKGIFVAEEMCIQLGLRLPLIAWHTQRDRIVEIGAALGILAGNIGKIGTDVSLLMQTEVAEVLEPFVTGKGGSSAMPHKRNPVSSIVCITIAQRVPPLVSSLMIGMVQDHERATGAWHAEWEAMATIIKLTAGSVKQAVMLTDGLEVDAERMRNNLELTNGLIFAESVSQALSGTMSKTAAHELVEQWCLRAKEDGRHLKEIIMEDSVIKESVKGKIDHIFNPLNSMGMCNEFIDRILNSI
ncbi:MAG TPA: 3-carboxy-cis,cis-muconate cycloisomerase [Mucilaginibacter sp.]|jgi:3-carboxy-cis,cis-muconate cycloisomerase